MRNLIEFLRKFRDDRGWQKFHTPKDLAISISIESAELLELFQWVEGTHDISQIDKVRVGDEAADVLIYILLLFDRLDLDPENEVMKKMDANIRRFPVSEYFGRVDK